MGGALDPALGWKGRGWVWRGLVVWSRGWGLSIPLPPGSALGPPGAGYLVLEVRLRTVLPALKHVGQLVQAAVVEVENLVLALPAGDHQLAAGAGLVAGPPRGGGERSNEYAKAGFYFPG